LLREVVLEILKIIEDVKAGRSKVDKEMDELTMALENPEHPGCCRDYGTLPPIEAVEEEESEKRRSGA
jgi:hypothetical protein